MIRGPSVSLFVINSLSMSAIGVAIGEVDCGPMSTTNPVTDDLVDEKYKLESN